MNDDGKMLDMMPVLRLRRRSTCKHADVSVDATLSDLECDDCGAAVNPYWWIQRLAGTWYAEVTRIREYEDKARDEVNRGIARMNARIQQLQLDVETLEAKKRKLQSEDVNGQPLGAQIKRWRRAP